MYWDKPQTEMGSNCVSRHCRWQWERHKLSNAGALPDQKVSCDSCDEKKIENLTKEQKLTGSSPRTHEVSALEASSSRNCRFVRPSPDRPDDARRHRLVCRQVARSFPYEVQACLARNTAELLTLSWDRAGAAGRDPSTSECEWPTLEPTRMRCATLSTPTELQRKITTNSVWSRYACHYDLQWCSERCCTTRSKRQNNCQVQ